MTTSNSHLVSVEVDPKMHSRQPEDEVERLNWAVLDTCYKLLQEYAVRVTLAEIRKQAGEQGIEFPTDEVMFEENRRSGDPDAPVTHMDLAPSDAEAATHLALGFQHLQDVAMQEAAEGIGFALGDGGVDLDVVPLDALPPELLKVLKDTGLLEGLPETD